MILNKKRKYIIIILVLNFIQLDCSNKKVLKMIEEEYSNSTQHQIKYSHSLDLNIHPEMQKEINDFYEFQNQTYKLVKGVQPRRELMVLKENSLDTFDNPKIEINEFNTSSNHSDLNTLEENKIKEKLSNLNKLENEIEEMLQETENKLILENDKFCTCLYYCFCIFMCTTRKQTTIIQRIKSLTHIKEQYSTDSIENFRKRYQIIFEKDKFATPKGIVKKIYEAERIKESLEISIDNND